MKYLLVTLFSIFCLSLYGQDLILKKVNGKYLYNGKEFKCKELGLIYKDLPEILDIYNAAGDSYSDSKITLIAAIGSGIGSYALMNHFDGFFSGSLITGVVLAIAAGLLTIVSFTEFTASKHKYKKAMNQFNYKMIEQHGYQQETSLHIGATHNGLGLVYSF